MVDDNKDIQGMSYDELKKQRGYAVRHVQSWREKLMEAKQADSKAVCRRELAYWQTRLDAIRHAILYHPDVY